MTVYEMQEDVGSFIWMRNECECLFFVSQKFGVFLLLGSELWWMHKVHTIALIKFRRFTKKKYGNSWKWAGFSKPMLHFIPFSFNSFN